MDVNKFLENEVAVLMNGLKSHRSTGDTKNYYQTLLSIEKIVGLLDNKQQELEDKEIVLTKEQALKMLLLLGHATYTEDGEFIITNDDRNKLINISWDMSWDIAEQLDIDINNYYIDLNTLEVKKF